MAESRWCWPRPGHSTGRPSCARTAARSRPSAGTRPCRSCSCRSTAPSGHEPRAPPTSGRRWPGSGGRCRRASARRDTTWNASLGGVSVLGNRYLGTAWSCPARRTRESSSWSRTVSRSCSAIVNDPCAAHPVPRATRACHVCPRRRRDRVPPGTRRGARPDQSRAETLTSPSTRRGAVVGRPPGPPPARRRRGQLGLHERGEAASTRWLASAQGIRMGNTWNIPDSSSAVVGDVLSPRKVGRPAQTPSRNISSRPKATKVGWPVRHVLARGRHIGRRGLRPCRYAAVGMFHGRMSSPALLVTAGPVESQVDLGENSRTPAIGSWPMSFMARGPW